MDEVVSEREPVMSDGGWEFVKGLALTLALNGVYAWLAWMGMKLPGNHPVLAMLILFFPLIQFLYVLPLARYSRRASHGRMWGVYVAGGLTFIAATAFWYYVMQAVGRGLR